MKTLLIFSLLTLTLFASEIDTSLLKVHATIFPKTVLMDYHFEKKLYNKSIVLALIYDEHNKASATLLKKKIETKYQNNIHDFPLKIILSSYSNALKKSLKATSYYLFPSHQKNIESLITLAAQEHSITFTYKNEDLEYGAMISTEITTRVKPVINIDALKRETISLRPILLKISKIYYQGAQSILKRAYDKFTFHYV